MAPQAGAAVEGICRASARPCPWPGGLRLLSRSSRHVWPGLWRPHGDLIRLPACAEFMVKCSALGRGTERGSLESRHASPLRPREPAWPGPGLGVGVRFFHPIRQWEGLTSWPLPGPLRVRICIFDKTLGEVLASGGRPGGLTAEVSENHEY